MGWGLGGNESGWEKKRSRRTNTGWAVLEGFKFTGGMLGNDGENQ